MKNLRNSGIVIIASIALIFSSCMKDPRTIQCDEFGNHTDLQWFAGDIGESFAFANQEEEVIQFTIVDKYIVHNTSYIEGTGCNCHDVWGVLLAGAGDSISMHSHLVYDEQVEQRYDNFLMKFDEVITGFVRQDRSLISQYQIGDIIFPQVLRYQFAHQSLRQFSSVYIAPGIGIIQMDQVNGDVWVNLNLEDESNIDFNSFQYQEIECR